MTTKATRASRAITQELHQVRKELRSTEQNYRRALKITRQLKMEVQKLQLAEERLVTAEQSLSVPQKQDKQTKRYQSTRPLKGIHAVGFALVEEGAGVRRRDLEKVAVKALAREAGLKKSGNQLQIKDFLSPGLLLNTLREKVSRGSSPLELKVIGRARLMREPEANRSLSDAITMTEKVHQFSKAVHQTTRPHQQQFNFSQSKASGLNM